MSGTVNIIIRTVFVTAIVLVTGMLTPIVFAQELRPEENAENIVEGKAIYDHACIFCHGAIGKGDGPVAYFLTGNMAPRPRDFTKGIYKFRSTPLGDLPTDEDLFRTVTRGIPGFMPSYVGFSPRERWLLIYYLKSLHPGFATATRKPIEVGTPVSSSMGSIHRGERLFEEFGCLDCHGTGGMGDGDAASDLEDDRGLKIMPANLTMLNSLKSGSRKEDIYRTIMNGLDGTPMPSFKDEIENVNDIWDMVNFILSLSESR